MSECKCDFRTFMVGDGCEVCNPAKSLEYAKETIEELEAECERLKGEQRVLADAMDEAARVLQTVEGDDDEENAALRRLVERLFDLSKRILLRGLFEEGEQP